MASRRVENVGLAILTFCTKREYISSSAYIKWWYIPLNKKKISNLGSLDVISGDILDRRDETILNFFELLSGLRNF